MEFVFTSGEDLQPGVEKIQELLHKVFHQKSFSIFDSW